MKLRVHLAPFGEALGKEHSLELQCGAGNQVLQWVAYTACSRLAMARCCSGMASPTPLVLPPYQSLLDCPLAYKHPNAVQAKKNSSSLQTIFVLAGGQMTGAEDNQKG